MSWDRRDMKNRTKNINEDIKAIVFYGVGLPRVYEMPIDKSPEEYVREATKGISAFLNIKGWAVVDTGAKRVMRSEGLSVAMYDEMDGLFGMQLTREPGDDYKTSKTEGEEEEVSMGEA
jgi:hypothetical protein